MSSDSGHRSTPARTGRAGTDPLGGRPSNRRQAAGGNERRHGSGRRARLSPRWRTFLRTLHVIAPIGLLGADASILVLAIAGWLGSAPLTIYPAAHLIGAILVVPLALLALITGTAIGALTPWGLLRYWWVVIKLVATLGGTVLALFVLIPTLDTAATSATATTTLGDPFALVKDSGGACGVLLITVLLAYYKPFGRIRRTGRPRTR